MDRSPTPCAIEPAPTVLHHRGSEFVHPALEQALQSVLAGREISEQAMFDATTAVMRGEGSEAATAALLTALRLRGETVGEIVGAARAMLAFATPIPARRRGLLDTCGTGGDELRTFNISTATALVAAACGVPVAKHGNRSVSSSSGSADVLEALGVNISLTPEQVAQCIEQVGIGFCFAPLFHGAMKQVAPVRRELGFRTIFNLLGPLSNPAGAEFQLLGANRPATAFKLAQATRALERSRAVVVCGNGELDEVALWGETEAHLVIDGKHTQQTWTAECFGLPECRVDALVVDGPQASAEIIRRILAGERGPARDIVLANTAAALFAAGQVAALPEGVQRAASAIDRGEAGRLLERLVEFTQSAA